jgi:hypothetical protein
MSMFNVGDEVQLVRRCWSSAASWSRRCKVRLVRGATAQRQRTQTKNAEPAFANSASSFCCVGAI